MLLFFNLGYENQNQGFCASLTEQTFLPAVAFRIISSHVNDSEKAFSEDSKSNAHVTPTSGTLGSSNFKLVFMAV